MKSEKGLSPLEWIIAIAVTIIFVGAAVAMIFGNEIKLPNKENNTTQNQSQTQNTNTNENVTE